MIGKALETARTVLRDLDADQVPASLRKVVAHAGELTPPLADRLARELDRLDWLRDKSLGVWAEAEAEVDGPDRGSALFLLRPEGWSVELLKVAGNAASVEPAGRRPRIDDAVVKELAVARDKAKALGREVDALRRRVAELQRAERAPERDRAADEARQAGEVRALEERLGAELAGTRRRLEEVASALKGAREDLRQARRDRADAEARLAAIRYTGSWADRDPVDLAVHLDAVAAQARRTPEATEGVRTLDAPSLPAGVRPDSAAAVEAVLRLHGPVGLLVDGYNAGLAMGSRAPAEVRTRLETILKRIRTLGGPSVAVTVVWDSAVHQEERRLPEGLDVRFTPAGVSADDVLVELASVTPRAIVVTNDREVRERAEAVGALTLWSTALVQWAKKRR